MQARIRIPDTFILVDRKSNRGLRESEPVVTIVTGKGTTGARIILSPSILRSIGFDPASRDKMYCQVFVSAQTLKIVGIASGTRGARLVTASGYVSAKELGQLMGLPENLRLRCKAEVVKNKSWEIWATYPNELREHIDKLNGVVS